MSGWAGKVMIDLVLLLRGGSTGELKQRRVIIREQRFISEGEGDVSVAAQPVLMTRWRWTKRVSAKCLMEVAQGCGFSIIHGQYAQVYTHSEQQWVLADPLNWSHKVTFQWNLCVFSATQQHAVLQQREKKEKSRFKKVCSWLYMYILITLHSSLIAEF